MVVARVQRSDCSARPSDGRSSCATSPGVSKVSPRDAAIALAEGGGYASPSAAVAGRPRRRSAPSDVHRKIFFK